MVRGLLVADLVRGLVVADSCWMEFPVGIFNTPNFILQVLNSNTAKPCLCPQTVVYIILCICIIYI
jgi:hypothetical protein